MNAIAAALTVAALYYVNTPTPAPWFETNVWDTWAGYVQWWTPTWTYTIGLMNAIYVYTAFRREEET